MRLIHEKFWALVESGKGEMVLDGGPCIFASKKPRGEKKNA